MSMELEDLKGRACKCLIYRYVCPATSGKYVIIRKNDDSPYLHINHVTVFTKQAVTTAAPASTCSPAGAQCTNAGFDMTGFEDVVCCDGTICGYGQLPMTTDPFYCTEAPSTVTPPSTEAPATVTPLCTEAPAESACKF